MSNGSSELMENFVVNLEETHHGQHVNTLLKIKRMCKYVFMHLCDDNTCLRMDVEHFFYQTTLTDQNSVILKFISTR